MEKKMMQLTAKHSVHYSSKNSEWETPQELFAKLNDEFGFDIDLCAKPNNAKCKTFIADIFSLKESEIAGKVMFCNPPYGRKIIDFVQKVYELATAGKVVCLLPARTDTKWWSIFWDHDNHCPRTGVSVRFLKGRLKFGGCESSAPFPSVIVIIDRRIN